MSYRAMMTGMARVSLRRNNNNLSHRILSLPPPSPPPTAVGTSLRHFSHCRFAHRLPPFCPLRGKYGYSPVSSAEEMTMEQPSNDASSDDSGDETGADEQKKPCYIYSKHGDDALYLKMDMPGVGKEDVKVYVEGSTHTVMVKGIRKSDPEFGDDKTCPKFYVFGASLTPIHEYKVDGIKAEMINGVLMVTVPKLKVEERKDVLHVQVN